MFQKLVRGLLVGQLPHEGSILNYEASASDSYTAHRINKDAFPHITIFPSNQMISICYVDPE